jgi:hypothetical protein
MKDSQAAQDNTNMHSLSASGSFGGLIPESMAHAVSGRLLKLISFLDATNPPFFIVHSVVTFFLALQLIGPGLCAGYPYWAPGSMGRSVTNVVSAFYHIVFPPDRPEWTNVVEFIFAGIVLVLIMFTVACGYQLQRTGQLQKVSMIFITLYTIVIAPLTPCIGIEFVGESIGRWISGEPFSTTTLIAHILSAVAFVASLLTDRACLSISLLFRPKSFQTVASRVSNFLSTSMFLITFILAIGMHLSKWPQVVLLFAGAALYAPAAWTAFMGGSYVQSFHQKVVFALSCAGGIHCLLVGACTAAGHMGTQVELLVLPVIIGLCAIGSMLIFRFWVNKQLDFLEQTVDNPSVLDSVTSTEKLILHICTGMQYSHPAALDWSLFRYGTNRWPDAVGLWLVYAKFAAIYPEDASLLSYLLGNIVSLDATSRISSVIIAQGEIVQMQQDASLSVQLKRRLAQIQKDIAATKRKLRSIWDLVIQGNIKEMENSVQNAYEAARQSGNDFRRLISQYPNNRFVGRSYVRFLNEITADYAELKAWHEKLRLLQRGILATPLNRINSEHTRFPTFRLTATARSRGRRSATR